jgi:hypothetical protein
MKVRVIKPFQDMITRKMTIVGDILEVTKERYEQMKKNQEQAGVKYFEELVEKKVEVETAVEKPKAEKAVKKIKKK